jgi:hypothetical protein
MGNRPPGWKWRNELIGFVTADQNDREPPDADERAVLRLIRDPLKGGLAVVGLAVFTVSALLRGDFGVAIAILLLLCLLVVLMGSWLLIQWGRYYRLRIEQLKAEAEYREWALARRRPDRHLVRDEGGRETGAPNS